MFQIPQTGWDKLLVSFIPHETGKPIAKTNKANVRNGSCKWSDPIYETTRLLLDTRTKQYDEKLYKLVVAMVPLANPSYPFGFSPLPLSTLFPSFFPDIRTDKCLLFYQFCSLI